MISRSKQEDGLRRAYNNTAEPPYRPAVWLLWLLLRIRPRRMSYIPRSLATITRPRGINVNRIMAVAAGRILRYYTRGSGGMKFGAIHHIVKFMAAACNSGGARRNNMHARVYSSWVRRRLAVVRERGGHDGDDCNVTGKKINSDGVGNKM